METAERRMAILRVLCKRRKDTVENLACEFGVSRRTVRRDIVSLSLTEPIYTKSGRYDGGVYVVDGYDMSRTYMSEQETAVMNKIKQILIEDPTLLSAEDRERFSNIILQYTKPDPQKVKAENHSFTLI